MEFQKLLLKVDKTLTTKEVQALAFLCIDLGCSPAAEQSASDLFMRLNKQDYLGEEQPDLLYELLTTIQHTRLLRMLNLKAPAAKNLILPYRKLLYHLSENLKDEDLKQIKFLLNNDLPRRKLDDKTTTLEVFMEMEKTGLITEDNLNFLENIMQSVCPLLAEQIRQFKAEDSLNHGRIVQETSPEKNQLPINRHVSAEGADVATVLRDQDESEAGSAAPSGLHTETNSCAPIKVRRDLLANSPEGHHTSTRTETPLTSNTNADLGTYPMTAGARGCCLIINNYNFSKHQNRLGTMVDEESLKEVFSWLDFDVDIQQDCKGEEMLSQMQDLADRIQPEWDCVVCCVLSHGLEGCVNGVDGNSVSIKLLMEPFSGEKCPSLAGKPKVFFIQACQGTNEQGGISVDSGEASDSVCIPTHADFLLGMATGPSFVSYRERENGTWYIQSLCRNLVDMVPRGYDLLSILTQVNADVSKKTNSTGSKKQMPQPAFTLRKKIVFPAPSGTPPAL